MLTFARYAASFMTMLFPLAAAAASTPPAHTSTHTLSEVSAKLATMQVPFIPNGGQWDKQAAFAAHTFAGTLFVTTEGKLVYSLPGKPQPDQPKMKGSADRGKGEGKHIRKQITPGWVLTETFIGANRQPLMAKPAGYRPAQAKASYMIGAASRHAKPLDSFERVRLGEVFKGVEVELRATGSNVEKIFTVKPHQDPKQIRLRVAGANKLALGKRGELIVQTGNGPVTYTAPIAYQEDASGKRSEIKVAYALNTATHSYGFTVGDYNPGQTLVIDPLLQSTYLGGVGSEVVSALAIHPTSGDVYVAGSGVSPTFPGTGGGAQPVWAGGANGDAFVSRFNASLTVLAQSTYLGGAGSDGATALAIHPASGEVYVAGYTTSTAFPGAAGGAQSSYAGGGSLGGDAFVSRFNASLTTLVQSTYLGGSGGYDFAQALAIHPASGEVYVAGDTNSTAFPGTGGGAQSSGNIGDAFVSRLNANLTTLVQSTYLGGAGFDIAFALAIHPASGEVYVAGRTGSPTFPATAGGAQPASAGDDEAFVSRLNASLTTLVQSTYLGGLVYDHAYALAIHPASGEVYVAGVTDSTAFPGVAGGAQPAYASGGDAFVSRFNASLTTLVQSTYLGGAGNDGAIGLALAIHPASGEVDVAGTTGSTDFPSTAGGAQVANAGGGFVIGGVSDAFVTRISPSLALAGTPGASTIPGAPVIGAATAGNAQATVSFTAPASNGGSAITGYTVTSSPGGITATGAASPITVTGLTNGTAYTFTVTASNAAGPSAASAASNSVTPTASAPAPSSGGGGGGSTSLPLLLALAAAYGWRRHSRQHR